MKVSLFLIILLLAQTIHAYQLNGHMIYNNDGTYEVTLRSDNDNDNRDADGDLSDTDNDVEFIGTAIAQTDGTLFVTVSVENEGSETYIGVATPNKNGTYDLKLRNNLTGKITTGVISD